MSAHTSGHHCASTQALKRLQFNPPRVAVALQLTRRSFISQSLSFLNFTKFISRLYWKETAPISFCLLKLGFLLFRFLLELIFSLFHNPVPLPDALSVWSSIFLRSSSCHFRSDFLHSVQLAEINVPVELPTKPFLLSVVCCFIYIEFVGSMERHAQRTRELLEVKTSRADTEWERERKRENSGLPTLSTLTLQIKAYKVCSIRSGEQIENTIFHTLLTHQIQKKAHQLPGTVNESLRRLIHGRKCRTQIYTIQCFL